MAGGPPPAFPVGTIRHAIAEITGPINIAGLQADVNARYGERREGERRVKSRSNSIKEMQRSLSGDLTDIEREALIGRIAAQEAELSLESAAETAAIIAHNQAMARLSNAQQRLGLLQKIDQVMARISALNDEMHAAAGNKDRQRETSKEILELARNLDLLLHPQEKKKEENIDVSSLSDEAAKKLLEELNKKFAPTT